MQISVPKCDILLIHLNSFGSLTDSKVSTSNLLYHSAKIGVGWEGETGEQIDRPNGDQTSRLYSRVDLPVVHVHAHMQVAHATRVQYM
jgi:hypothetical protein